MSDRPMVTVDGNEAVAMVAHRLSEVCAIYPITPSSPMGEFADDWSMRGRKNIWGAVPDVVEMQSEGGAAGAVHGALQAGSLCSTYTASQGLLLMIPNMYKIAGELTSFVMHVTARSLATHALSIFGDHSDVMACRQTGFAMLASNSVQEAHDLALIAHAATLRTRLPFMHFFDGFRTSHEVSKIEALLDDDLRALIPDDLVAEHRRRALSPDRPQIRGTAQNPDVFFQAREACNPWYLAAPDIIQQVMDEFGKRVGREYKLFDYVGHPEAERVVVMMGSGAEAAHEAVEVMAAGGEKVGLLKVRLFRPFSLKHFVAALPASCKTLAVLDRTKEPGAPGEPLFLDVVGALREAKFEGTLPMADEPVVVGGRYGLSSKEFTPAMVKGVFDHLKADKPKYQFTVGINDDVTGLSIAEDADFATTPESMVECVFYGLGSDGTVGANKNSIKIIGEDTDNWAQGYFVYDSKKSGATTISHLRFGPEYIRSTYLITRAKFVGVHQFNFVEKFDVLGLAADGATLLLNSGYGPEGTWDHLPREMQEQILEKKIKCYVIDAYTVAQDAGMGRRINTVMQTCFFAISGVLPRDEAIAAIKQAIKKTYGSKGDEVVLRNWQAVDQTLENLHEMAVPAEPTAAPRPPVVPEAAPDFVKNVTAMMMKGQGDLLPVSAFSPDGTWPVGTTQWEKRDIALEIPLWDPNVCIQCNKCALVCPHATIRAKVYDPADNGDAPEGWQSVDFKAKDFRGKKYVIQVAPLDCTGCGLCVEVCPGKDKSNPQHKAINMMPQGPVKEREEAKYQYFLELPNVERTEMSRVDLKNSQFVQPLFEYSGACAGCGETPYIKLMTQLFGDRMLIANATGCSSIYGGNLPTTPYCTNDDGRGPAWANSLFEDNAEFGFGFRLAVDSHQNLATVLLKELASEIGESLVDELLSADQTTDEGIEAQRKRVAALKERLGGLRSSSARHLAEVADYLVKKSVWIVGGDGWAYDIGYGGLDHVMASGRNVNILVLDTEVYSNTGGQASKATPIGAAAKFAASGKAIGKKDLGLMAMSYRHVYVASIAMGARDVQTVTAFQEAESYDGPSIIIAYSHCIAHGYDLVQGMAQQDRAVNSGIWPMYRYDPRRIEAGEPPLQLDSKPPKLSVHDYMRNETRFRMVERQDPDRYRELAAAAADHTRQRVALYQQLAGIVVPPPAEMAAVEAADEPGADGDGKQT